LKKFPEYKELDLTRIANSVSEYWEGNKTFEKSISIRKGNPKFVFFEGPPSANGMPGIHHVMARTIKDIFCRYKTQKGFIVERKAGWDTHGLPVELGVEKQLGITKEDIGKSVSVKDYNKACREAVMKYTDVWNLLTKRIGYWVDMQNPYVTFTTKYIESVWWLIKKINDKSLLYKGYTIQPYSPMAGTGLSSHELNQPGTYKDVSDTSITAQFKVIPESLPKKIKNNFSIYILAWTTTPWTLPSNTALTVGLKIKYVIINTYNQYTFKSIKVIIARELVDKQFDKKYFEVDTLENLLDYNSNDKIIPYLIESEVLGKDLVGIRYEQIWSYSPLPLDNPENAFRVISGDFVTTEEGTGVVHTAPTFGADDAKVAKQAVPEVPPLLVMDQNNNKVPLVNLNLIVDYYPKGYREIQYINTINLQNHYFKKWRSFVLNQKDKKQYNHFLSPFDDEISKLSNLLFYIIIRDHNQYYVKNLKDTNVYLRYRCYENKADLIKKKIENFRDKYIERKSLGINILMNELCILIRDRMKPFYNKRIKIILTPRTHLQVKKKREFQVKKYLNPEEIRKVFPPDTQERELLDYFLDEIKNFQNNNYFTFLKNSQNYILRYPFYTSDEMLTPFLDISGYSFEFFSNEELVDSEYEQNSNDDLLEDNLFD